MIPKDFITEWRRIAPWIDDRQVEQDLVISRALVELFSNDACRRDSSLYEILALVDAIRGGRARERAMAAQELTKRMS